MVILYVYRTTSTQVKIHVVSMSCLWEGKKHHHQNQGFFLLKTAGISSYHALHVCPTGNQHNKPAITKVYGSLQSAQALLLPANILRKQHWLKIKSNKTLLIPMPSAFSVKTKLLQHPKEGRIQLKSKHLHYLVQNGILFL